jgi:hypothetical protein
MQPAIASAVSRDHAIIRALAQRKRELGLLPRQGEAMRRWADLNALRPARPLVLISQIPWHEFEAVDPAELKPRCSDPWLREVETTMRRELYQWDRFPGDTVIDPFLLCPLVCGPTSVYADYGIQADEVHKEGAHDVQFVPIIASLADVERIKAPRVWVDHAETTRRREALEAAVDGAIPVLVQGLTTQWHTPWDMAVRWYGVERLMYDLIDKPDLVAAVCGRMCDITGQVLDEQERLGILDIGNGNCQVGSGGLGCSDELPTQLDGRCATARDQWGCGNAQIFSEVSAAMHEEFSLRFERPVIERFGLSYYGCCEPLHRKVAMLRTIRNLRKISMSPKADLRIGAAAVGRDYVLSFKPNPAHLASDGFDEELVRGYLRKALDDMVGCNVEIILKDITTARGDPRRLLRWERLAMEEAQA